MYCRGANARALANQSSFSLGEDEPPQTTATANEGNLSARNRRNANSQTQESQPLNRCDTPAQTCLVLSETLADVCIL